MINMAEVFFQPPLHIEPGTLNQVATLISKDKVYLKSTLTPGELQSEDSTAFMMLV